MWNILDQPWTLLVSAVIVFIILAVIQAVAPFKHRWPQYLIPIFIAVFGFGLDYFVVTDNEKIRRVISAGVNAIENESCEDIAQILAENYKDSRHPDKAAALEHCSNLLTAPLIDKIYDSILELDITGRDATVITLNRMFIDERSELYSLVTFLLVKAKLQLQKQPDNKWLITNTEVLAINNQPVGWTDINRQTWQNF